MNREHVSRLFWWGNLRLWQSALTSWGWQREPAVRPHPGDPAPARQAMMGLLAGLPAARASRLAHAIAGSRDVAALWQMRGALMQAIAMERGETYARGQIAGVDALLLQAWPEAPVSRPAGLE